MTRAAIAAQRSEVRTALVTLAVVARTESPDTAYVAIDASEIAKANLLPAPDWPRGISVDVVGTAQASDILDRLTERRPVHIDLEAEDAEDAHQPVRIALSREEAECVRATLTTALNRYDELAKS